MPIKKDFAKIQESLEQGIKVVLNDIIDGTVEELDGPIRDTVNLLTQAVSRRRPDLVGACKDQLALIILEKELRLKSSGSNFLDIALNIGLNALVNGAIGGLGGLKVV